MLVTWYIRMQTITICIFCVQVILKKKKSPAVPLPGILEAFRFCPRKSTAATVTRHSKDTEHSPRHGKARKIHKKLADSPERNGDPQNGRADCPMNSFVYSTKTLNFCPGHTPYKVLLRESGHRLQPSATQLARPSPSRRHRPLHTRLHSLTFPPSSLGASHTS